jgi:hypothetical protein
VERLSDTLRVELGRFGAAADLGIVLERWPEAVGYAIARNAWPSRIARDGTLHVNTADSVWAFELSHRAAEIAARLEVPGVKFAPGPLALEARDLPVPAVPEPTSEELREAAEIASEIADENLRKTVEKSVALSLAGRRDRRSS